MKEYRIAVIAGDGIGPEVMAECKKVLEAAAKMDGSFRFAFTDFPWGCEYYLKTGQMMPEDGIETLRGHLVGLPAPGLLWTRGSGKEDPGHHGGHAVGPPGLPDPGPGRERHDRSLRGCLCQIAWRKVIEGQHE